MIKQNNTKCAAQHKDSESKPMDSEINKNKIVSKAQELTGLLGIWEKRNIWVSLSGM